MCTVFCIGRIFPTLLALLTGELCFHRFEASLVLRVEMTKTTADGKRKKQQPYFSSKPFTALAEPNIKHAIQEAHQRIDSQIDKWTRQGSGLAVLRVVCLYVNISKYTPLKVSSYIDLPKYLKYKKAIVNVQNTDQQCLRWALLSFLNPAWKDAQRVTKYIAHQDELDFTGREFPTPLNLIPNVERLNGLAINVFGYSESAGIHPLYPTKDHNREPINLLLITEVNEGKTNSHSKGCLSI